MAFSYNGHYGTLSSTTYASYVDTRCPTEIGRMIARALYRQPR